MKRLIRIERVDEDPITFEDDGRLDIVFGPEVIFINERMSAAQNAARVTRFIIPIRRLHQVLVTDA